MPVWHAQLKTAVAEKRIALVGVIQEQHAERCRLFAQWQGFDWPILHDPINLLGPLAVPIVVAVDEHGTVRHTRPTPEWVRDTFLATTYPAPSGNTAAGLMGAPDLDALQSTARTRNDAGAWRNLGDALVLWEGDGRLDDAVNAYRRAAALDDASAPAHFRLGVALRMRFDSSHRRPEDFQDAVVEWGRALDIDPNHYIYRRRIQQYGPRLIKPYPFYDWVEQARAEIRDRGATPVELSVEPSGAEFAHPAKDVAAAGGEFQEPDPERRIRRDATRLIEVSSVTVPSQIAPGEAVRIHLEFRPSREAHWNNETDPAQVWINTPSGWTLERPLFELPQAAPAESRETRRLEFEVQCPADVGTDRMWTIPGYVLYSVCEDAGGQCLYLRQDFEVSILLRPPASNE